MPKAICEQSLDWMPKSVWGPIKWKELHARGLIDKPMDDEERWFQSYLDGLPCPKCRNHFEQFLKESPPNFDSRKSFFHWTVEAHNFVNVSTGKRRWSVEEAYHHHRFTADPAAVA